MKLCRVCKENKTGRLMDEGWGEKLPVCTACLVSGRYKELLPTASEASTSKQSKKKAKK